MMVCLLTHVCVTRPQWVNMSSGREVMDENGLSVCFITPCWVFLMWDAKEIMIYGFMHISNHKSWRIFFSDLVVHKVFQVFVMLLSSSAGLIDAYMCQKTKCHWFRSGLSLGCQPDDWLPARWASGFSGDHQQNHHCLWFHSCNNATHVFCPSLFVFCWE